MRELPLLSRHQSIVAVLLVGGCLVAYGCKQAQVEKPVTADIAQSDPDSQLLFWHTLAERPLTSNDDAFHGMLLYLDERDDCPDYAARVALLKQRGLLPASFNQPASAAVERGTVAVMIVKTLSIRGGWAMHVFGPTPRYALRELMSMSILPYSSPQQIFSGAEFVGVIGALEDYQKSTGGKKPASPTTAPAEGVSSS